jgi:hypothetical protein
MCNLKTKATQVKETSPSTILTKNMAGAWELMILAETCEEQFVL